MKKLIALALAAACVLSGCGSAVTTDEAVEKYGSATLKFYNWGEYVGDNVIADFEKEYGVDVISEYFDSNEAMYTKLQAGDVYDVLVPSDYMIERLINEDMLQPIDKSVVTNLDKLADGVKSLDYDPDNTYSVPYFWGTVGLVYNKNNVSVDDLQSEGFGILKDEKYKGEVYIYDSERDAFMIALKALGYSMNTEDENEINEAYEWLRELNSTMEPSYVTDEVIDSMVNGNKDLAVVYSGDAAYILSENEDMGYFVPNEGTNLWSDAMVIPKNAENPKLANEFINYILTYDASYDNSSCVGYASSNAQVLDEMSAEDGEYGDNEAYMPRVGYANDEIYHDNETLRIKLSELWSKVKAE
jgi:spermidine/putrescine-binding protein